MNKDIRGFLKLEVDSDKLYGYLLFERKTDGLAINAELVHDVLAGNGIKQSPLKTRVDEFLKKCADEPDNSFKYLIVEGLRPEPPFGEQYIWDKNAIPADREEFLGAVKQKAPPPEIYYTESVLETVTEEVQKKGKFPFSQAKTETVSKQVHRDVKRKAVINPEILEYRWVPEGAKIARIQRGLPGKQGMNLFGQIIQSSGKEKISFYLSDQFRKDRDSLYALCSGFLRIGGNWADIVEITEGSWDLTVSNDHVSCFLDFSPAVYSKTIPDAAEILAAAVDKGFRQEDLIPEDVLANILTEAAETGHKLEQVSISGDSDGSFRIEISEDKLKALLHIRKGRGSGKQVMLKEIGQAILLSKIKGINQKRIQEDLLKFYKSNVLEINGYILAEGKAPEAAAARDCHITVNPQDEELTKKIKAEAPGLPESYLTRYPSLEIFGWKNVELMTPVKKGEVVAKFTAEQRGTPGRNVYGEAIAPEPAGIPEVSVYENIIRDNDSLVSQITGILDFTEHEDGSHKLRVRQHRDCDVHVEISGNKMAARISMIKEFGTGQKLTKEHILAEVERAGVKFGVIDAIIDKALAIAEKKGKVLHVPFAKGQPPKHASEKGIKFFVEFEEQKKLSIRQDGSADFKNRGDVTKVTAAQKIAELPGEKEEVEDGSDVCGNKLAARPSVVNQLQFGKNVELKDHEGKKIVIAKTSGELVYEKNLIDISSSHFIRGNVDMKTGNIKYPGDVKVAGTVSAGFYIMAGGTVQIGQGVESSLVSADGSIEIAQGIVGQKKAVIRAKDNISAVFAEQATLLAVGDINIQNSCLHCNIKTNGKVNLLSEKGYMIGGHILARSGLNVMNIGNEQGTKTRISFGQDYLVADQIQLEEREIDKLKVRIVEIDKKMKTFIDDKSQEKLDQVRKEKLKCMKLLESRNVRLFTLRERFEEHQPSEVIVRGKVYPGTQFESHGRFFEVNSEKTAVSIFFNPETGHIQDRPISAV